MGNIDLRGIVYFAFFGMACAVVAVLVGIPYGIWWAFHHITIR